MKLTIGQWTIETTDGHWSVKFPVGETNCEVLFSTYRTDMPNMLEVRVDDKKLLSIPLPEKQEVTNDAP